MLKKYVVSIFLISAFLFGQNSYAMELFQAIKNDDLTKVKRCIEKEDFDSYSCLYSLPLHCAVKLNKIKIAQFLIITRTR